MTSYDGGSVDELVAALREDPVQVHQMLGNGRTEEVREGFREIVEEAGVPAYVVLAPAPDGLSANDAERELATLLHDRLGDGLFVVQTDPLGYGGQVFGFGDVPDPGVGARAALEHAPDPGADAPAPSAAGRMARELTLTVREGDVSGSEYQAFAEETLWRRPERESYDDPGGEVSALAAGGAFLLAAFCTWVLVRALTRLAGRRGAGDGPATDRQDRRPRWTRPAWMVSETGPGPAEVRRQAEQELDALAERLAATSAALEAGVRVLVDGSYDTARAVLAGTGERPEGPDLDDLVGALVLTRIADRAVTRGLAADDRAGRRRRKRPPAPPRPYLPCFFDPRHGEGAQRRRVPVADRDLVVPACGRCQAAPAPALSPMQVSRGRLGRLRPWYELDTVWARTGFGAFTDELWRHVADEVAARAAAGRGRSVVEEGRR